MEAKITDTTTVFPILITCCRPESTGEWIRRGCGVSTGHRISGDVRDIEWPLQHRRPGIRSISATGRISAQGCEVCRGGSCACWVRWHHWVAFFIINIVERTKPAIEKTPVGRWWGPFRMEVPLAPQYSSAEAQRSRRCRSCAETLLSVLTTGTPKNGRVSRRLQLASHQGRPIAEPCRSSCNRCCPRRPIASMNASSAS